MEVIKSTDIRWVENLAHIGEIKLHKNFWQKPENKRLRRRRKDGVKMYVSEVESEVLWSELIWLRMRSSGGLLSRW
jgi:diphthamide synthase (EF-2-diphthine--ammonia ligase)